MKVVTMPAVPERKVMCVRYNKENADEIKAFCKAKRVFVADDSDKTLYIENIGIIRHGDFVVYGDADGSGWFKYSVHSWKVFPRQVLEEVPVYMNEEFAQWYAENPMKCRFSIDGKCKNRKVKTEKCNCSQCELAACELFQNSILRGEDNWRFPLKRYRFKTKSVDDYRPLIDFKTINMPWWCTSECDEFATIVCYLPFSEDLSKYWDDAYDIDIEDAIEIMYSDRYPKPDWIRW